MTMKWEMIFAQQPGLMREYNEPSEVIRLKKPATESAATK